MTLPASASAHHTPQIIQPTGTTPAAVQQQPLQPPLPHQYAAISANSKLKSLNKTYLLAHNLIPRRQPIFSSSRATEVNFNATMLERPPHSGTNNLAKLSSNFRSSECISPTNVQVFTTPKQRIFKFLKNKSDENILNRKSAFKPVNSGSRTNIPDTSEPSKSEAGYTGQPQLTSVVSCSSGASSTTSSISNSVSNSMSFTSKLSSESSGTVAASASNCNQMPDNIRSGSVSSARSIYELRLKSLNESNMQALVNSTHSQRLHSSGSAHKLQHPQHQQQQPLKPERNFQSVKIDKHPRRRTHLSDNDYLQALTSTTTKSSPFFKADKLTTSLSSAETGKLQANLLKFQSNSSIVLHKFLLDGTGESTNETHKTMADAQRRLSYHNYRSQQQEQYNKFPYRKSVCVEVGGSDENQLIDDDLCLDMNDYDEDDDIFEESCAQEGGGAECDKNANSLSIGSQATGSNSSATTASSSSSLVSSMSDALQKQQNTLPIKQIQSKWDQQQHPMSPPAHSNQPPFASASFLSSTTTSSSSMSPASYAKPPQTPKSPSSSALKYSSQNVFNFNLPPPTSPQEPQSPSVRRLSTNAPPPLPFQSTQLTNVSQINFMIVPSLQNFSHFDVQSVFFNYDRVKLIKDALQLSINMRTGASAAHK